MNNEREDIEMNIKKLRELKKNKKGFTLIEIIVVIVILAVLMAVAVPSVLKYLNEADDAKYIATTRAAYIAAEKELVDAYTDRNQNTYEQALNAAAATVNGTGDANASTNITSIDAKVKNDAGAESSIKDNANANANPSTVVSYVVTFKSGKEATLVPNGNVTLTE